MRQTSLASFFKSGPAPKKPAQTPEAESKSPKRAQQETGAGKSRERVSPAVDAGTPSAGRRVSVFWPKDNAWYSGTIESVKDGKHTVLYDDGDEEVLDLTRERYRLLSSTGAAEGVEGNSQKRQKQTRQPAAKRRRKLIDSDDDSEASGGEKDEDFEVGDAEEELEELEEEASEDEDDEEELGEEEEEEITPRKPVRGGAAGRKRKHLPSIAGPGGAAATAPENCNPNGGGSTKAAGAPQDSETTPLAAIQPAAALRGAMEGLTPSSVRSGPTAAQKLQAMRVLGDGLGSTTPAASKSSRRVSAVFSPALTACSTPLGGADAGPALGSCASEAGAGSEQFGTRMYDKFDFLRPERIMDQNKRRPGDPDYNPRTLFIPPSFWKGSKDQKKISEGQRQWWEFKAQNFDSVLLFKMGKFYEMFEMDAHIGVEVLGLTYMKGEQPHAGFPEKSYQKNAEGLVRAGYRVVVIEQTETPEQLKARNEANRGRLPSSKVVLREKVAVLTQGTLSDPTMLASTPSASYLVAIVQLADRAAADGSGAGFGVCAVDVSTAQLLLGQFADDQLLSRLQTVLAALQPVEMVLPQRSEKLDMAARKAARAALPSARVHLVPDEPQEAWSPAAALAALQHSKYFEPAGAPDATPGTAAGWPPLLEEMKGDPCGHSGALSALGGMLCVLREALLDRTVLSQRRVESLAGICGAGGGEEAAGPRHMAVNGAALENLEVLQNSEGGTRGTLVAALDSCRTPYGRRLLQRWLCQPLFQVSDITERQDAVQELMGAAADAAAAAAAALSGLPDLERAVARLGALSAGCAGREAAHVVLYEDAARRRVQALHAALSGLQALLSVVESFSGSGGLQLQSRLLQRLVTPGQLFPDLQPALQELLAAADWDSALNSGRIEPAAGVDAEFDQATERRKKADAVLQEYLEEVRTQLRAGRAVCYVSCNKDSHLLEVPDALSLRLPPSFELVGQRKGAKRYRTEELQERVKEREAADDAREKAVACILSNLTERFGQRKHLWLQAVEAAAQLDVLMSFAKVASNAEGPMCRPKILLPDAAEPVFRARQLRHPAAALCVAAGRSFVANDVLLGGPGRAPRFQLITGPNMGGKSTMLRQVCLAAMLGQLGAWVPAEALEMTPVDALFVRMGARDRILAGESTFLVELAETAAMLQHATSRSLVVLDELGRGTATLDGAAIASAVLADVASRIRCRGMFATHYHLLSEEYEDNPNIALMYMAVDVQPPKPGASQPQLVFLYQLTPGACPKSHGTHVARLAGLPDCVLQRASHISQVFEDETLRNRGRDIPTAAAMEVDNAPDDAGLRAAQRLVSLLSPPSTDAAGEEDSLSSETLVKALMKVQAGA